MSRTIRKRTGKLLGFTLIELLVVIAIIAILAAILFPVFAQAREAARATSCRSNLKQFGNAFAMYRSDYDGRFPFGGWFGANGGNPSVDTTNEWHQAVYPYVKNAGVYKCPSSTDDMKDPRPWPGDHWRYSATDYLYNNNLAANRLGVNESVVSAPADCIQLIEGHNDWGRDHPCTTPFTGNVIQPKSIWCAEYTTFGNISSWTTGGAWGGGRNWGLPRHQNGANILFTDGHVKTTTSIEANTGLQSRQKMESRMPFRRHMSPDQSGGTWGAFE